MPRSPSQPAARRIPGTRRDAREWAAQILFELDAASRGASADPNALDLGLVFEDFWELQYRLRLEEEGLDSDEVQAAFKRDDWRDLVAERAAREFCEGIVEGVTEHLGEIDSALQRVSDHWALDRMGGIERSVLRMGTYELLYRADEVPRPVAINEAIDVCKYFGMRESAHFVNGLLDQIAHRAANLAAPRRAPAQGDAGADDADRGETWTPEG